MIMKKRKISRIGTNKMWFKRVDANSVITQEDICAICGVGKGICKTMKYYSDPNDPAFNFTLYAVCHGLSVVYKRNKGIKYIYVPFSIL